MLNQTSARQVWRVLKDFFERYPDPSLCCDGDVDEMIDIIKPLGLYNRRAKTIKALSREFVDSSWKNVLDLPGIGKYASDSYTIFIEGYLIEDVDDKELKNYLSWATNGDHGVVER